MKTERFYHPLQLPTLDSGLGGWAVWGGEGQGPVTAWLGQCLGRTLQVPLGLAGGTAPSAVWRGQAWARGWLEAQLPAHRGLAATPLASLSRGQAGRASLGCPGPGRVFCTLLEKPSAKTSSGPCIPVLPSQGVLVPSPHPGSQHWGEGAGTVRPAWYPITTSVVLGSLLTLSEPQTPQGEGAKKPHLSRP